MGFASYDQFIAAVTAGQTRTERWLRTIQTGATSAAGRTHETMSPASGTGGAMVLTGTAGVGIPLSATTIGALPIEAAVPGGMTRHLASMMVHSPSTTLAPGKIILTDLLHLYPSLSVVTTPTSLSNHPTFTGTGNTRMSNAIGVEASALLTTASSAAGQLTLNYRDSAGADQAQAGSLFSPVAAHPAGCFFGQTPVSATPGSPTMARAAGDIGVQRINSYTINANATGGVGAILLHRPIASVPIRIANDPVVYDFTTGPKPFPKIHDNACLALLVQIGGALTTNQIIEVEADFVWN
jgi:hypothetical protein